MTTKDHRLIVLDLDGTLLDADSRLPACTKEAVQQVLAKGLMVTLATGRLFSDAAPYAKELDLTLPLILNHGSMIQTIAGDTLFRRQIDGESAGMLIAIARETDCACQLYSQGLLYLEKLAHWNQEYLKHSFSSPQLVPDLVCQAMQGPEQIDFLGEPSELEKVESLIKARLGTVVQVTSSYKHLLEILPFGISKGTALEFLANHLGIPRAATIAVGDGYNDLEMITAAGFGVSMGNAPLGVQAQANHVIPNKADGLAEFLLSLIQ